MSSNPIQTFENHTRWHPVVHFFILPVTSINAIVMIVVAVRSFSWLAVWNAVMAIALAALAVIVRFYATKNQDRIIRVEETVRLWRILPPEMRPRIADLSTSQLVAIRFASDDEVPELVRAVLAGEVRGRKSIKQRIRNWRADTQRV
jgi:hypothetical protein